jgi:hypothetical protein
VLVFPKRENSMNWRGKQHHGLLLLPCLLLKSHYSKRNVS